MKRLVDKTKGLVRGASTGVLVSIGIHAALLVGAAFYVAFEFTKRHVDPFEPPPKVEPKKMPLKKPQVKVKKAPKPSSPTRIVTKNNHARPTVALPVMKGSGKSAVGGDLNDGFKIQPNLEDLNLFGSTKSTAVGNDFEGTYYSLAYDRRGRPTGASEADTHNAIRKFHEYDWNPRVFAPYYRSPQKLYATHFMIPPFHSYLAAYCFGIDRKDFEPGQWIVHFKGRIAARESGRYRFWGYGDQVLIVRIGDEIVLDATYFQWRGNVIYDIEPVDDEEDLKYPYVEGKNSIGHWFELEAETPVEMQVLMSDEMGLGAFMLAIEKEGEEYSRNQDGLPMLPIFKTAELNPTVRNKIQYQLIRDEFDLYSDLMFNVY